MLARSHHPHAPTHAQHATANDPARRTTRNPGWQIRANSRPSTMLTTRLTFVLASSLLVAPALAFGAVPACADMDAPLFSMLMDELFSPGE